MPENLKWPIAGLAFWTMSFTQKVSPVYFLHIMAVIGGSGGGFLSTVEEYDPMTNTWAVRASMPTARFYLGVAAATNGKIYAIGGYNGVSLSTVEEYDPTTDTWATRASMPTARGYLGVTAAANGKIYAIGGENGDYFSTVEEYDPATDTWATRASMPTARGYLGVTAAANGKVYAIGGYNDGSLSTVEEYNPATNTWTARTDMPTPRYFLGVEAANNKLYAIGGQGGDYLHTVEEYTLPLEQHGYHVFQSVISSGNLSLPFLSEVLNSTIGGNITTGDSSLVQNTTASGGITLSGVGTVEDSTAAGAISLGSGTAQNNTVTGGSISIGSGQVLSNTVRGGGINVGGGSIVSQNDVEGATGWTIQASGTVTISQNRLVGNTNGIQTQGGAVQGNLIANNDGTGLEINGNTTANNNTFTAIAGSTVKVLAGASVSLTDNNFEFNTGDYDIENLTAANVAASSNWWGTTDTNTIDGRIFDFNDDFNKGTVQYASPATGPDQTAPAYVRRVTVLPDITLGIQIGTFEVQFSKPMDTGTVPALSLSGLGNGVWATRASIPTARSGLGVVAANGKLYAIGGYNNGPLSTVEEYDPATNIWTTRASMPTARGSLGVAAANGKLYAIGGYNNVYLSTVEEYNPVTDTWTTRANMPTARGGLGLATASNGKLYAIGGHNGSILSTVEEYDPVLNTWTTRANMLAVHGGVSVVAMVSNSKLYAVGGIGGFAFSSVVDEYNPSMNVWTARTTTSRIGLGVAESNGKVYAIGGEISDGVVVSTVGAYDPASNTWAVRANMPTARTAFGVTANNGKFYVIGGSNFNDGHLSIVEEYTPPFVDSEFYNNQWVSSNQYRANYDITSLIPRDIYNLIVQGAIGADGIETARNSASTVTVDYAGAISDNTPPLQPSVSAAGDGSLTTLSANWSASDPQSPITQYRYAIGTTPGGRDVVNWTYTNATSMSRNNLNLTFGITFKWIKSS